MAEEIKLKGLLFGKSIEIACEDKKQAEDLLKIIGSYFDPCEETLLFMEKEWLRKDNGYA